MARTSLQQSLAIRDPLQSWNFDVFVSRVPGLADTRPFTYHCLSAAFPGSQIEQVLVEAHGIQMRSAGRRLWGGTWTMNVVEDRTTTIRDLSYGWMELARSPTLNTGTYKSIYATPVEVTMYDDVGLPVRSCVMYNAWISDIAEVSLAQSSTAFEYAITFTYDFSIEVASTT